MSSYVSVSCVRRRGEARRSEAGQREGGRACFSNALPIDPPPPPTPSTRRRPPSPCLSQLELLVVWLLLILTVVATFFVQRHRVTALPPAAASMLLGIAAGVIVRIAGLAAPLRFSPAAFFYGLLPPIVFAAGFTLKKVIILFQNRQADSVRACGNATCSQVVREQEKKG